MFPLAMLWGHKSLIEDKMSVLSAAIRHQSSPQPPAPALSHSLPKLYILKEGKAALYHTSGVSPGREGLSDAGGER